MPMAPATPSLPQVSFVNLYSEDPWKKRQRVRIQQACSECRRQKIKCDGQKPCKSCQKSDRACIYATGPAHHPHSSSTSPTPTASSSKDDSSSSSSSHQQPHDPAESLSPEATNHRHPYNHPHHSRAGSPSASHSLSHSSTTPYSKVKQEPDDSNRPSPLRKDHRSNKTQGQADGDDFKARIKDLGKHGVPLDEWQKEDSDGQKQGPRHYAPHRPTPTQPMGSIMIQDTQAQGQAQGQGQAQAMFNSISSMLQVPMDTVFQSSQPPPPQQQQWHFQSLPGPLQGPAGQPSALTLGQMQQQQQQQQQQDIQDINTCIDDLESKHTHNTLVYIMESLNLTDSANTTRKAYDLVVEKKSETRTTVPPEISLPPDRSLPNKSTDLPSIEIRDHLVDTYFTYRYPVWPIVHKHIFLTQLHDPNNTPSLLLLNALFAYASRYSSWPVLRSDPAKAETAGQLFLERAQAMLPAFLMAPRLSTVQALLFLAQLEDNSTQRHTYHSMAVRMAQLLDLHKNCQHLGLPDDEKETRRCIWWTCYMNDRLLALSTRKPSIIRDGDCTIDMPFQEHLYDGPGKNSVSLSHYYSPPQLFHQLLLLSKIVGGVLKHFTRVATKSYRTPEAHELALTTLDETLFTWLASLPDHLQYTPPPDLLSAKTLPSPFVAALHLYFYSILHTLHNPYMDSSNPRATADMPKSSPSLERCTLAASMITSLARSLCFQPQYGLNFGTQCYAILHAAIMHLTNTANTTAYQSLKSKSQFISTLSVIKAYSQHYAFEGVKRSSDVMDNIYNWQVARHQDESAASTPTISSVSSPTMSSIGTVMREVKHPDHHHVLHHLHHPYLRSDSTPSSPKMTPTGVSTPTTTVASAFPSLGIPASPAPSQEPASSLLASRTRSPHPWQLTHNNSVATSMANTPTNSGSPMLKPEIPLVSSAGSSSSVAAVNCSSEPSAASQALLSDIYSSNPTITFDDGRVSPLDSTSLGAILGFELPHSSDPQEDDAYWNAQANSLGGMDGWNQQLMSAQEHVSYKGAVGGPAGYLGGNNSFGSLEPNYFDSLGAAAGMDFSGFGVGATGTDFGASFGGVGAHHTFAFQTLQQREQEQRQQQRRQFSIPPSQPQHQQAQQQQQQQQQQSLQHPQSFQTKRSVSPLNEPQMFIKPEPFQFSQDLVNQVYQKSLSVLDPDPSQKQSQGQNQADNSQARLDHRGKEDLDFGSSPSESAQDLASLDMSPDASIYFNSPLEGLAVVDDTAMQDVDEETW